MNRMLVLSLGLVGVLAAPLAAFAADVGDDVDITSGIVTTLPSAMAAQKSGKLTDLAAYRMADTAQGLVVFDVAEKTIYRLAPKKVHRYELESAFGGGSIDFSGTVVAVNSGIPEVEVKDYSVNRRPKPGAFKGCL
jgi:hypothetical protein